MTFCMAPYFFKGPAASSRGARGLHGERCGMEHTASAAARPRDWILSNPWLWIAVGLGAALLALGCVHGLSEGGGPLRFFLVSAGLLSAGAALTLRLRSSGPAYIQELSPGGRSAILMALSG